MLWVFPSRKDSNPCPFVLAIEVWRRFSVKGAFAGARQASTATVELCDLRGGPCLCNLDSFPSLAATALGPRIQHSGSRDPPSGSLSSEGRENYEA